ncbi:hypothetical protein O181_031128 [Austropuccinia psidii MF-1]|uniref:Uncharacterized protein n=1 Tax=Austropuccinia psidii MF-1 TaxID=1389203 RepID=A0A9Q3CZ12_9BASI|nr:hypothetical protein [Austropuccinia psidii MF-1]
MDNKSNLNQNLKDFIKQKQNEIKTKQKVNSSNNYNLQSKDDDDNFSNLRRPPQCSIKSSSFNDHQFQSQLIPSTASTNSFPSLHSDIHSINHSIITSSNSNHNHHQCTIFSGELDFNYHNVNQSNLNEFQIPVWAKEFVFDQEIKSNQNHHYHHHQKTKKLLDNQSFKSNSSKFTSHSFPLVNSNKSLNSLNLNLNQIIHSNNNNTQLINHQTPKNLTDFDLQRYYLPNYQTNLNNSSSMGFCHHPTNKPCKPINNNNNNNLLKIKFKSKLKLEFSNIIKINSKSKQL